MKKCDPVKSRRRGDVYVYFQRLLLRLLTIVMNCLCTETAFKIFISERFPKKKSFRLFRIFSLPNPMIIHLFVVWKAEEFEFDLYGMWFLYIFSLLNFKHQRQKKKYFNDKTFSFAEEMPARVNEITKERFYWEYNSHQHTDMNAESFFCFHMK